MGKAGDSSSGFLTRIFLLLIVLPPLLPSLLPSLGNWPSGFSFLKITFFLTPRGLSWGAKGGTTNVSFTFFTNLSWGLKDCNSGSSVGEGELLGLPFFLFDCCRPCGLTWTPPPDDDDDEDDEDEDEEEVIIENRFSNADVCFSSWDWEGFAGREDDVGRLLDPPGLLVFRFLLNRLSRSFLWLFCTAFSSSVKGSRLGGSSSTSGLIFFPGVSLGLSWIGGRTAGDDLGESGLFDPWLGLSGLEGLLGLGGLRGLSEEGSSISNLWDFGSCWGLLGLPGLVDFEAFILGGDVSSSPDLSSLCGEGLGGRCPLDDFGLEGLWALTDFGLSLEVSSSAGFSSLRDGDVGLGGLLPLEDCPLELEPGLGGLPPGLMWKRGLCEESPRGFPRCDWGGEFSASTGALGDGLASGLLGVSFFSSFPLPFSPAIRCRLFSADCRFDLALSLSNFAGESPDATDASFSDGRVPLFDWGSFCDSCGFLISCFILDSSCSFFGFCSLNDASLFPVLY